MPNDDVASSLEALRLAHATCRNLAYHGNNTLRCSQKYMDGALEGWIAVGVDGRTDLRSGWRDRLGGLL